MRKQAIAAFAAALLIAHLSFAHAVLLEAKPVANGWVSGPDIDVELRFNSRIDSLRSRITLVLPDQTVRALAVQLSSAPGALGTRITGLSSGEYRLRWQVLAADGHITRGEFSFHVK